MKKALTTPPAPPAPTARAEAELLLGHPVTQGLLGFLCGHAVILDAEGRLLASSEQALSVLGLPAPFPPKTPFPSPEALELPIKGFRFANLAVQVGGEPAKICVFKDIRDRGSQEARAAQRQLLAARQLAEPQDGAGLLAELGRPPRDERDIILVVDDSMVVLRLLDFLLTRENCRVITAANGKEGLAKAFEHVPDLILLDAMMPGMNGFEVCRRLKADPRTREIPVLFVTILRGEIDEVAALEAGAIDFIPKPITPTCLLARVHNHLELKHSKDRLRALSLIDGLTGIANRRQFDQGLELEWQRAARDGKPISLIMGDVDHFKKYNDRFGHAQGDECLRRVAQVFKGSLRRPGDLAARFGGEEFVCILPDTDEAGARRVAEEILAGIAALALPHPDGDVSGKVTLSLGVVTGRATPTKTAGALAEGADMNLYEAKRLGRNRIAQGSRKAARKKGSHQG